MYKVRFYWAISVFQGDYSNLFQIRFQFSLNVEKSILETGKFYRSVVVPRLVVCSKMTEWLYTNIDRYGSMNGLLLRRVNQLQEYLQNSSKRTFKDFSSETYIQRVVFWLESCLRWNIILQNAVHFHVQVVGLPTAILLFIMSRLFISAVSFFGPNKQLLKSHEALSLYALINGLRT